MSGAAVDLRDQSQRDLQQVQGELDELHLLVRQMEGEVERASQRCRGAVGRLRDAEKNLESIPRSDLQNLYTLAGDEQMRLIMMQGQREQLESKQRLLERCRDYLQRVLDAAPTDTPPTTAPAPIPSPTGTADAASMARVIQAQEDERHRLARQIHDGPAQSLTNVVLRAEICQRLIDSDPARARAELEGLKEVVRLALQDTRRFIFDVRPMILDDLGLLPTLRRYIQTFSQKSKVKIELTVLNQQGNWPIYIEVAFFRVIQEALDNATRHASASRLQVKLDLQESLLEATVEDNGRGFDVESTLQAAREHRSLGIASMRERMEALGGSLSIDSAPGRGTRVRARLPAVPGPAVP